MKKYIRKVGSWQQTFKQPFSKFYQPLTPERAVLRDSLLAEEVHELREATVKADLEQTLDALADVLYVTFGTIVELGLQDYIEDAFDEVHASNMTKLPKDGVPLLNEHGKILKPDTYTKPDFSKIMHEVIEGRLNFVGSTTYLFTGMRAHSILLDDLTFFNPNYSNLFNELSEVMPQETEARLRQHRILKEMQRMLENELFREKTNAKPESDDQDSASEVN